MKKILILMIAVALSAASYAQKGEMSVGANISLGAGQGFVNPGIGAECTYSITDPWRVSVGFDYGFRNQHVAIWDLSFDAHYQFFLNQGFRVYPIAGFAIVGYNSKVDDYKHNTTCVGANLGAGAQYDFNETWGIATEFKGQLVSHHGSRFLWQMGACYKF